MSVNDIFVYKYRLPLHGCIELPIGARPLSVGTQDDNNVLLWAEVDPRQQNERRQFGIYGTGQLKRTDGAFIGTVVLFEGALVFHVFDETTN